MKVPRRLVEENELFAALVDDAKRREPPPDALGDLLAKLSSGDGLPPEPVGSTTRSWSRTTLVLAGTIALASAVALGVWESRDRRPPPTRPSLPVDSAPPVVPASTGSAMSSVPSVSIDELPDAKGVVPSVRPRITAPLPSASQPTGLQPRGRATNLNAQPTGLQPRGRATNLNAQPEPLKPASLSVRREIELIARAREALTRGDSRACLEAVDLHDREFSAGQFVLEAQVMRIEATLASGDRDGARSLARDYLAKNPSSPYETRVRSLLSSMEKP